MRGGAGQGLPSARPIPGGVTIRGGWPEVWRANLEIRGASRVLARIGTFRALHLAQLDKRARRLAWGEVLRRDVPFRVEASCNELAHLSLGRRGAADRTGDPARSSARPPRPTPRSASRRASRTICAPSASIRRASPCTSAVTRKPSPRRRCGRRMAALFLRQCGYDGTEPVVDPMCGSGTFVIEAAEIAAGLEARPVAALRVRAARDLRRGGLAAPARHARQRHARPAVRFYGSDRDAGAIRMSRANAERAGVAGMTEFQQHRDRGSRRARRTAGPRHRQPALRRPHRRQAAPDVPLPLARANTDDPVRRLARRAGDERSHRSPRQPACRSRPPPAPCRMADCA